MDFKDGLTSIKVMLSAVASISPTTAAAEFLPQIPPLFLAPFTVEKKMNHVFLLSLSEILISVMCPYSL